MGKASSSSCLSFIVCGTDSPVEDGGTAPEAKGSSDRRGWSFRKKSSRHRVLSNSVITENHTPTANTTVSEKAVSVEQLDKKLQPDQQDEKPQSEPHFEKPQPELHVEKLQPLPHTEVKPHTSLESKMLETVDASRSSNTINSTADETLEAQPGLSKSLETKTSETVVEPFPELPKSMEATICESTVEPSSETSKSMEATVFESTVGPSSETSKTMDATVCETVAESAPELSESVEIEVTETDADLSLESLIKPSTEPQTSVEPEVCETMPLASAEPNIHETVVASQEVDRNVVLDEPCAVVIQSGVRGYLAQTELSKLRSVVKLQAVIRGHLVRRQAVDTLHCFQGIVKVQNMIRSHQGPNVLGEEICSSKPASSQTSTEKLLNNAFARQLLESTPKSKSTTIMCDPMEPSLTWTWLERWMAASSSDLPAAFQKYSSGTEEAQKPSEDSSEIEAGNLSSVVSNTKDSDVSLNDNSNSILRSESSFKDARSSFLRSDSSFNDEPSSLLRSESNYKDAPSSFLSSEPSFKDAPASYLNSEGGLKDMPHLLNPESSVEEALCLSENEVDTSIAETADIIKSPDHLTAEEKVETPYDITNESASKTLENIAILKNQNNQFDSVSQIEPSSIFNNTTVGSKELKLSVDRPDSVSDQIDVDGKRLAYGSKKVCSPAFIAAQSKFKELSSAGNSGRSLSPARPDNGADYSAEADMGSSGSTSKSKASAAEVPISDDSKVHIGGSECGTELSVTSTLDSPDRSEAGEADIELKFTREKAGDVGNKDQSFGFEANNKHAPYTATDISSAISVKQKAESSKTNDEFDKPVVPVDSEMQAQESKTDVSSDLVNAKSVELIPASVDSSLQIAQKPDISSSEKYQMETTVSGTAHSAHGESPPPKVSSNNPNTIAESQETTPSQVPKTKKGKPDKSGSQSQSKKSSISASKRSPSHNRAQDSIARSSSAEHVAKDQKSDMKRRNSIGSTKIDNDADQEPRDSTSSVKVLPRYMQATQTARAKANSPRSSPDVHENKDTYAKKRHSLPGATGKQGSPRVQLSPPQAAQPTKSNGNTPTSQERKWVR